MTLAILSFFTYAIRYLANGIFGLLQGFFDHVLGSVGSSVDTILMDYAFKVDRYGVWSVPLLVLLIGLTISGLYALVSMTQFLNDLEMGL